MANTFQHEVIVMGDSEKLASLFNTLKSIESEFNTRVFEGFDFRERFELSCDKNSREHVGELRVCSLDSPDELHFSYISSGSRCVAPIMAVCKSFGLELIVNFYELTNWMAGTYVYHPSADKSAEEFMELSDLAPYMDIEENDEGRPPSIKLKLTSMAIYLLSEISSSTK